eukprot:m.37701 g.37701  ORF g.37701 m.37701 type:complete len:264 (-) comp9857_c0_seq2:344-1135(-)
MDRDDLLFSIHLAHVAGRYDDMLLFLKRLIHMGFEFHDPERELLHAAFAGLVESRRAAAERLGKGTAKKLPPVVGKARTRLLQQITDELHDLCQDGYYVADRMLARVGAVPAARACLLRLKGDLARVRASVVAEPTKHIANARTWYEQATQEAAHLSPAHPTRLALALNYAVLLAGPLGDVPTAATLARTTLSAALLVYDRSLPDHPRIAPLLTLLRTNLGIWAASLPPSSPLSTTRAAAAVCATPAAPVLESVSQISIAHTA